jgi:hypothetical protein
VFLLGIFVFSQNGDHKPSFLVASFHGFVKIILEKKLLCHTNSMFKREFAKKKKKNSTIAFNMKVA